jgi:hypothetical protein
MGKAMSFRPITITAPVYRAWATLRLADMQERIRGWSLPEMYAGVPGLGATDAWYEVLTKLEHHKLHDIGFCGGVADIMKFFDQILRNLVYKLAAAAGMPERVLTAYTNYLENMQVYNALAGGGGDAIQAEMRDPPGVPLLHDHGCSDHEAMDRVDGDHGGGSRSIYPSR